MRSNTEQALLEIAAAARDACTWIEMGAEPAAATASIRNTLKKWEHTIGQAGNEPDWEEPRSVHWKLRPGHKPPIARFIAGQTTLPEVQISYTE